jgi:threonine dehydrogenase-like Zn-dependent dehydrogenase
MAAGGLFPGPFPLGHETVAQVLSVGDEVRTHRAGDRVLVPFQVSCGKCAACQGRRFGGCTTYRGRIGAAFGFGEAGGGFGGAVADQLAVPAADRLLVPAPAGISAPALATLPDDAVDGFRASAVPLRQRPGAEVLVVAGMARSVALYAVAIAVAAGTGRVRYVDRDASAVEAAARLGAEVIEHQGTGRAVSIALPSPVDATGDPEGLAAVLRSTDDYGYCTSAAIYFGALTPIPLLEMYTRGVTFHVSRADARRFLPAVADLVADGRFQPLVVPTTIAPWEEAPRAWLEPAAKLVLAR